MIRAAWLQKHPTPAASGGEFHWYPADGDRELRARFAERLAGAHAGDVLWQLAPGEVAWAVTFAATSPLDGRRYTGLALAVATGDAAPSALLEQLAAPAGAPWSGEIAAAPAPVPAPLSDPAAIARALLDGGDAAVGDPGHPGLPRAIAAIERVMPAAVSARMRRGAWTAGTPRHTRDRVAELAVDPGHARAWRLACELATGGRSVDDVIAAVDREPTDWLATLHAWGRGAHDHAPGQTIEQTIDQLADRVALRVLARLLADRDPAWAIAEARWHALLPAPRRSALLAAVARRADTLRAMIDG